MATTPRSFDTQQELDASILRDIERIKKNLADSPISAAESRANLRGFYFGYCDAMQWDATYSLIVQLQ